MKKITNVLLCAVMAFVTFVPFCALAKDDTKTVEAPSLKSISFNGATIVESFSPLRFEYQIKLDDSNVSPTLEKYEISSGAEIFVTKTTDTAGHQNGVNVEVKNANVSANYAFFYVFDKPQKITSNCYLASFECVLGEVYPSLNENDTNYTLYVPNDLTELQLSAMAQDASAVCVSPDTIKLNSDQNPEINVAVTASDTTRRDYYFQVKRVDKTCEEVKEEMSKEGYTSFIKGELFYQRPEFKICVISIASGLLLVLLIWLAIKHVAIKVEDADEFEFFD